MIDEADERAMSLRDGPDAGRLIGSGNTHGTKRSYDRPRLLRYGSIAQLTNSTMMGGVFDAAGKGKSGS